MGTWRFGSAVARRRRRARRSRTTQTTVNARRTLFVVGLTSVMMVGEIVAGTVFTSMALLADGFHMATHAGALAAAAYAFARPTPQ